MLTLRALGAFEANDGDRAVDLGGPRQRSVLALLVAARGRVVAVDRIVDDLWRGEPPPSAIGALQAYISHLRRALEPDRAARSAARVLVSAAPGYALRLEPQQVDAWHFEDLLRDASVHLSRDPAAALAVLDEAQGLWRGPAYAQFRDEPWAAPEAARLEALRVIGIEQRAEAMLALGQSAAAVPDLEAHAAEHPLREEAWRLLALALYRAGRQADALAALRRVRTTLADELGLDPGPALRQLEADVLAQAPGLLVAAQARGAGLDDAAPPPPAASIPGPGDRTVPRDAFVGRAAELAALDTATRAALSGRGQLALIAGEPGAGKSALADALSARLGGRDWLVGWGRCPEGDGAPPGWPWMELLRDLVKAVPPAGDLSDRLAPLLDDSAAESEPEGDVAVGRFRLHRAVGAYLAAVADETPLLVVLDDVHRADADSLALLTRAVTDLRSRRALVVATYRHAEVGDRLTEALAELAAAGPLRIQLSGLTHDEVADLVRSTAEGIGAVDDDTLALIADRTEGNPFFVQETARLLASEGRLDAAAQVPAGVRDVLRRRLARLPASAQAVLRLASVIGREVDVDVLIGAAAAADTGTEDEVLDGLEAGLVAGLLTEVSSGIVRFSHVLVRDALYEEVSQLRRVRLHGRVAEALERLRPGDVDALAHHYGCAAASSSPAPDVVAKALRHVGEAARMAKRRFAHAEAVTLLERGLALSEPLGAQVAVERLELLIELVGARAYGGNAVGARTTRTDAIRLALSIGDDDLIVRAMASWTMPTAWSIRGYAEVDDEMVAWIDSALQRVTDGESPQRCRLLCCIVAELEGDGDERTSRAADEALRIARRLADPELIVAGLNARYFVTSPHRHLDERRAIAAELVELGTRHDMVEALVLGHQIAAQAAAAVGDMPAFREQAGRAATLASTYGLAAAAAVAHLALGMHALITGDFARAEATYDAVIDGMRRAGAHNTEGVAWLHAYFQREVRGDDLGELLDATRAVAEAYPDSATDAYVRVLLACGREDEARAVWDPARPVRPDYFETMLLTLRGRVAAQLGDVAAAERMYGLLAPFSGHLGGAGNGSVTLSPVDTVLGELAVTLGRPDDARRHYADAIVVARRAQSPHFEAEAAAGLAAVVRPPPRRSAS